MQRKVTLLLTLLLLSAFANAQNVSIVSFKLDEKDNSAQESELFDQNGEVCALIKIVTDATGFSFDVGSLGVTAVQEHDGETWLFVPFGIKKITLHHQDLGSCEFPIPIVVESGKTYRMVLATSAAAKEVTEQELEIKCSPVSTTLYIDDVDMELKDGELTTHLSLGVHSYSAEAPNYIPQSGTLELKETAPAKLTITLTKMSADGNTRSYQDWINQMPVEYIVPGTEVKFTMIAVPPATYVRGGSAEQTGSWDDELPTHDVKVDGFFIGQTEVTQELWEAIMGTNPSRFRGEELPVEQVSWNDCQLFISRLNAIMGQRFRLPTEAEWELAARSGTVRDAAALDEKARYVQITTRHVLVSTNYSGSDAVADVAWYMANSEGTTHTVATKQPNMLGLYDMSGNVVEWCQDWYQKYTELPKENPKGAATGTHRICRGGSWISTDWKCRTAYRDINTPETSNSYTGLRLAM
jgi:formylglycine-generating enzyme required for sulfatase activity